MMASPTGSTFKVVVHSVSHEVPDLTEEEKLKLEAVLQKAKEFEEDELRKPVEGQLYKYTNVVRGWQFRWFVLTPETGMLEYYMMDEPRKNRPKGGLHLSGAVVSSNEEDNYSFTVHALCGEMYRLKASDAKDRQYWMSKLESAIEINTVLPLETSTVNSYLHRTQSQSSREMSSVEHSPKSIRRPSNGPVDDQLKNVGENYPGDTQSTVSKNSLASIRLFVNKAVSSQRDIAKTIEQLPIDGMQLRCSDSTLLLLKATSQATVQCLECCYLILKQNEHLKNHPQGLPPGATIKWIDSKKDLTDK